VSRLPPAHRKRSREQPIPNGTRHRNSTAFETDNGKFFLGDVVAVLRQTALKKMQGKIQLIVTSPPFPLNKKKSYGNLNGKEYLKWFKSLAPLFAKLLTPDGSIVIEIGNAWEPGRPVQSLLPIKALMGFLQHRKAGLRLCQEFICYNPSRLPSPAAWVTTNRIRAVDSYTHIWWMAKTDFPKADNSRVLRPYSKSMKQLLARRNFNSGFRPSEHRISEDAFLKNCGGSISHNIFEIESLDVNRERRLPNAFSFSNTASNDFFSRTCQKRKIVPHPARMPIGLAAFFIQFLTEREDCVLDPFAGTNTTGYAAQRLGRRWFAIDASHEYAKQAQIRFEDPKLKKSQRKP
jgi:DNA modification methylase